MGGRGSGIGGSTLGPRRCERPNWGYAVQQQQARYWWNRKPSVRHGSGTGGEFARPRYRLDVLPLPVPLGVTWQDAANLATVFGVFVALLVGIATTIVMIRQEKVTRDGQKLQHQQAEAIAARTEAAAALTEDYSRRVVEALESIAGHGRRSLEEATSTPEPVRWSLTHQRRSSYLLENRGGTAAKNVRIFAHPTLSLYDATVQDLGPNEAMTFLAVRSMATRDNTLTVTWDDPVTGETRTWRYPLPPEAR